MNISFDWLKQYINIKDSAEKVSSQLTDLGLEVEGLSTFQSIQGGLNGLIIGEVIDCEKHPNADKLKITSVNIGEEENLQIVCGAPNIAKGQKVIVATINSILYPSDGERFKIKKSKIRGELSQGMICAEDEIGLGTGHDGIIVLNADAKVGQKASEYYNVSDDFTIEIGLTPNRADGASHVGVARDLKALYDSELILPDVSNFKSKSNSYKLNISVENFEACPRYSGLVIEGLKVQDSPDWIQTRLKSIGLNPTNNIVDITNFVLHELGQPLHAFDLKEVGH